MFVCARTSTHKNTLSTTVKLEIKPGGAETHWGFKFEMSNHRYLSMELHDSVICHLQDSTCSISLLEVCCHSVSDFCMHVDMMANNRGT